MTNTRMFKILWAIQPAKFFLVLSIGAIITFSSCNKASVIGLDIQPDNDLIDAYYQDTLTLLTQTVAEDSLKTDGNLIYSGLGMIGKYMDPVFGQATSSVYSQFLMFTNAPTFGENPVVDSVRLTLVYNDLYGKKARPRQNQTLNVYLLTEDLDVKAVYYSHQKKNYSVDITETNGFVFTPKPNDSIIVFGKTKQAPALRVPLQKSFGQSILDKQNTTDLATNENFLKFIKGVYLTTEKTQNIPFQEGNIINFNMYASRVNIYYHNKTDDSLEFNLNLNGARFMHFDHVYTPYADPDLQKQLVANPPVQNDVVYVQSMAGLKTKLTIPNLLSWGKRELIAINRAELEIKSISTNKDTFKLMPTLNLMGINEDGKTVYVLDDAREGSSYFGGFFDSTNNTYRFNITRQIQQLITERKPDKGFFISSSYGPSTATRVVLGGGSPVLAGTTIPNNYQMKLKITYTKLK